MQCYASRLLATMLVGVTGLVVLGCGGGGQDTITIVGRQNSSGTYAYFQERVLGKERDYTSNTIDQSSSKDVVELVGNTPSAIGYSGMGYTTEEVKMLGVSEEKGGASVEPTLENAKTGAYPIARPLFMYTLGEPTGAVKHYIEWIMSEPGQEILIEQGCVPLEEYVTPTEDGPPPEEITITIQGSDTMVNVAGVWAEQYRNAFSNVSPQVNGGGSGTGIKALIDGQVEIANSSRPMKPSEKESAAQKRGEEVKEFIVGRDAIAIFVHHGNPLDSISIEELAEIYGDGGAISKWTQIQGWPAQ